MLNYQVEIENRIKFLQDYVKQANANGVIIGVSGGKDSAVVATLAKKSFSAKQLRCDYALSFYKARYGTCQAIV